LTDLPRAILHRGRSRRTVSGQWHSHCHASGGDAAPSADTFHAGLETERTPVSMPPHFPTSHTSCHSIAHVVRSVWHTPARHSPRTRTVASSAAAKRTPALRQNHHHTHTHLPAPQATLLVNLDTMARPAGAQMLPAHRRPSHKGIWPRQHTPLVHIPSHPTARPTCRRLRCVAALTPGFACVAPAHTIPSQDAKAWLAVR
jgi:hypothetical protein